MNFDELDSLDIDRISQELYTAMFSAAQLYGIGASQRPWERASMAERGYVRHIVSDLVGRGVIS